MKHRTRIVRQLANILTLLFAALVATAALTGCTSDADAPTADAPTADAPTANADSAITARGVAVIIDVIANDENADGADVTAWSEGDGGSVSLRSDGRLVYAPGDGLMERTALSTRSQAAGGTPAARSTSQC